MDNKCYLLIKKFEGCKLKAYLDSVGVPTIGYGATYYKDGSKVKMGDKMTQQEADDLLQFDIQEFSSHVKGLVKSTINDNQEDALISFAYNVGLNKLKKSTLLKKVNANPNDETIQQEFEKWDKAGGVVLPGLLRRRKSEAYLYFTGKLKFDF